MTRWQALKKGDIIDIVAPASHSKSEVLPLIKNYLEQKGFKARTPKDIFKPQLFLANTDEKRLSLLKKALYAPDSKAIWCVRGGYGSNRLIPELAKLKKSPYHKIFLGLSDVTSVHLFLNQKWKWPTLHSPNINYLSESKLPAEYEKEVWDILTGQQQEIVFKNLQPINKAAKTFKILKAPVVGGNLMTLQSSIATQVQIDVRGKILFFEELSEKGYRVDRMLQHLTQSGALKGVKAVVLGDFTDCQEADGSLIVPQVLKLWAESLKIPVLSGIQSGHDLIQRIVPFNTQARLTREQNKYECAIDTGCDL